MQVADLTSKLSYAKRLQVGAVVVKGHKILATGYNGMPAGWDNNCEYEDTGFSDAVFGEPQTIISRGLKTKPEVLHAESNAITKLATSTESSEGSTMFCTHAPCIHCAKLIYQSGIKTLYYMNTYRDSAGLEFLEKSGVIIVRHSV